MAVKKSALYSKLWDSCNTLRSKGGMDATQYKDYVLIILFMKVITDKYCGKENSLIEVPEDANFNTMISLKGKKNIGEEFNTILAKIAEENDLQGIIDVVDFNDENKLGKGKDMVDALTGLIEIFQDKDLDFSNNRADDDDILGDAYEYLMKKFATEAGKSKGQFYTPSEVSRIMAKILNISSFKQNDQDRNVHIYDMACGSGSLLLKAGSEVGKNKIARLYGQEKDANTTGLCVMNMFLHGNETASIKNGNTLTNPQFLENGRLKTFDFCVANPPFSVKKWNVDLEETYDRFTGFGMPPEGCADYAFLLHMLKSMDPDHGRAAIILPHGVLFRGGQEELIRKNLIKKGYIEGIIGLPANLFYGTGIPACIIVLDKKDAPYRKNVFIIDASKNFVKDGNKNKLREQDIKKIIDTYTGRIEEEKYSKNVSMEDVETEEYNLNIPRYVDASVEEMKPDLKAHLLGGIPMVDVDGFDSYWKVAPNLKNELFSSNSKKGYYNLNVEKDNISEIIKQSNEIKDYFETVRSKIKSWEKDIENKLLNLDNTIRVKELIETISDKLLEIFNDDILINKYDAYEYLMKYYEETFKDDLYMVTGNGWIPSLTFAKDKKGNIKKNEFDSELLPKDIVINKYFKNENNEINELNSKLNNLIADFDSIVEENTGDEQLFNDDEKVNEKALKDLKKEIEDKDIALINILLNNLSEQKELKKEIKDKQESLNDKVIKKYNSLTAEESKNIIIYDKWFESIENKFNTCMSNLINSLAYGITNLDDEYESTLTDLNNEIEEKEKELSSLLKDLVGDEDDLKAFSEFINQLGGDANE